MLSLVIPVYKNEDNLSSLLEELVKLNDRIQSPLEVIFVVDGSPDACLEILRRRLPSVPLQARVVELSRNFGSFSAIVAGLSQGAGDYFAVLAADLQEPPELILEFQAILQSGSADVAFGYRAGRSDDWLSRTLSTFFWSVYRRLVVKDIPAGGIDVFACTREVRDRVLELRESNTNLIALLFWIGFRRQFVPYERRKRVQGRSAWTFAKKLQYALNSIFNFTDLPIRLLLISGGLGTIFAVIAGLVVLIARLQGRIPVMGYTPLMLLVAFFAGLTTLGLGIIGQYLWLSLQNVRGRPNYIIRSVEQYPNPVPREE